jgi:uncharacterized NAD-dependent epimerase/dehydratase family protein
MKCTLAGCTIGGIGEYVRQGIQFAWPDCRHAGKVWSLRLVGNLAPDVHRDAVVLTLAPPYLLFLGDVPSANQAKTAFGLKDWAPELCIGEFGCGTSVTTGLTVMTPQIAYSQGARSLVIGIVNLGGVIPDNWIAPLLEAMEAGLDIVSGMHGRLSARPELASAAVRLGRRLIDVRIPPDGIGVGTGRRRSGRRLLTVGTDCALGKKYTALALTRAFCARGIDADFRATGQTGIMIAGSGVPIDAVVADFVAGAAEAISPAAAADHWDVIEGQGSLFHPSYAGVSLGLLHGSQPDVIVVCHEPGRTSMAGLPDFAPPDVDDAISLCLSLGGRTNPDIRCGGISLNTSALDERAAADLMARESERLGLPVADPIRGGANFSALVDACLRQ